MRIWYKQALPLKQGENKPFGHLLLQCNSLKLLWTLPISQKSAIEVFPYHPSLR
jgi:hypothetical protein